MTRPLQQIFEAFREAESILVLAHIRPDGDAIGSTVALARSLAAVGHRVVAWNEDGVPDRLAFLDPANLICRPNRASGPFDLVVALDTATKARVGESALEALASSDSTPLWINIDHHASNPGYGDINLIDPDAPATGQILFDLIRHSNLPLDPEIASSLYIAISTDTGSFQYPSTTAATYEAAASLVRAGADVARLNQLAYEAMPRRRFDLMRQLLASAEFHFEGRCACMTARLADFDTTGAKPEDIEDLITMVRAVDGVAVALLFEELAGGLVRISARSKSPSIDVSVLCSALGGGGHPLAAGARKRGSLEEVRSLVLSLVHESLQRA